MRGKRIASASGNSDTTLATVSKQIEEETAVLKQAVKKHLEGRLKEHGDAFGAEKDAIHAKHRKKQEMLEHSIEEQATKIRSLAKDCDKLKEDTEANADDENLKAELSQLQKANDALEAAYEKLNEKKSKESKRLTDKIKALQDASKKQTKELKLYSKLERQQNAAETTILALRKTIEELSDAHSRDEEAITAAHEKVISQTAMIDALEAQLQRLQGDVHAAALQHQKVVEMVKITMNPAATEDVSGATVAGSDTTLDTDSPQLNHGNDNGASPREVTPARTRRRAMEDGDELEIDGKRFRLMSPSEESVGVSLETVSIDDSMHIDIINTDGRFLTLKNLSRSALDVYQWTLTILQQGHAHASKYTFDQALEVLSGDSVAVWRFEADMHSNIIAEAHDVLWPGLVIDLSLETSIVLTNDAGTEISRCLLHPATPAIPARQEDTVGNVAMTDTDDVAASDVGEVDASSGPEACVLM
eukprot:m.66303 g.66303  ORF g.66303 m.66303 type:complete len:475 (-) comp15938_c0_seq1:111-1535(-)